MTDEPLRTLVVDDVEGLRVLVRTLLEDDGRFEVVGEAADGREAVDGARELVPDLVLLDLSMPGMDGLEALPRIRTACPEAAVVVFSTMAEATMGPPTRRLGALGYLEKATPPDALVQRLWDLLDQGSPGRFRQTGASK